VKLDGTITFPFVAVIPLSVRDNIGAGAPLLYGHGFFGDRSELEDEPPQFIADDAAAVAFAIDWQGMSVDDIGEVVASVAGEVSESIVFGERVMQAMINWQTVSRAIKSGVILEHDAFRRPKGEALAGAPVVDVDAPMSFMGISQGHVLGGTLSALNADIERSILHVGGAGLSNLMFRARPFSRFLFMLDISLPDPLDQQKLHAHMQSHFDRFEPAAFARFVVNEDVPIGPSNNASRRRVLVQMGIGDTQVPNPGTEMHVRYLGIPQLSGAPVFGVEQGELPAKSGFVSFDLGIDPSFYASAAFPEEETIVHEALRRTPECREQVATFIQTGLIVDTCGGECVVEAP
jgi:hypothetical protein